MLRETTLPTLVPGLVVTPSLRTSQTSGRAQNFHHGLAKPLGFFQRFTETFFAQWNLVLAVLHDCLGFFAPRAFAEFIFLHGYLFLSVPFFLTTITHGRLR
jgi:hypothetical protein